jgi:hypothetical protein
MRVLFILQRGRATMDQLATLARWEGLGFVAALAAIIVLKILTGSISLNGLLTGDRKDGTQYFSAGRSQLLLITIFAAANYIRQVIVAPSMTSLPDIPVGTLEMLGASQLFYLAGKARALGYDPSTPSSWKGNS